MSFADEISSQAKTKEQVAREAAEDAEKQEKQQREIFRANFIAEFEKITETIKSRIAEAAQSGNYRVDGGTKVIQDTFVMKLRPDWNPHYSVLDGNGIAVLHQAVKEKRPWFGIDMPKSLDRILLKAKYPDVFQSALGEIMDGLGRDGIEAAFVLEWDIPYKSKYDPFTGTDYWRRTYQIPWEQLSEGYTIQDWFKPASTTIDGLFYDGALRKFRCTYKFRF